MKRSDKRTRGPVNTPIGLAPPHPERASASLRAKLNRGARAIKAEARTLATLSREQVAARVRQILRSQSSAAAIARSGAQLEASTRSRFESGIASLLASAKRTTGDRGKRSTTISLSLPPGAPPRVTLAPATDNVDRWAARAAKMIRSVEDEAVAGIARDVVAAVEAGETPAQLAARWGREGLPLKGGGRLESRLALIADNQIARLNGELHRARAKAAGLEQQRWVTMGDAKVRPEHRAREGKVYPIDKGIDGEHPGDPPNCRCHAESVVTDDDLDRLLGLAG